MVIIPHIYCVFMIYMRNCFKYKDKNMLNISEILENILLEEKADETKILDAIKNKYRVVINYNSHGENIAMGWRIIEVFAYGLTKAGNPVIRAYQPQGDTASHEPDWKFFRVDRILDWRPTGQYFNKPRPKFNPNGDMTMSAVYSIASFNDNVPDTKSPVTAEPRRKEEPIYVPYGEKQAKEKLNNLQRQVDKPVYKDEYTNNKKTQDGFQGVDIKNNNNPQQSTGPKKKIEQPLTNKPENDIFKTDTEQQIDRRKEQLNNPQFVDPSILRDYERNKNKRNNRNI